MMWKCKVKLLHASRPEIKVFVGSGMTRGTGLADVNYVVADDGDTPVSLAVQLQADKLKLILRHNQAKAKDAANALWQPSVGSRIWFDFGGVKGGSDEFPKKGTFNQCNGTDFYRAIRMGPTSPKTLVKTIVRYIRLIRDNEAAVRQQLCDYIWAFANLRKDVQNATQTTESEVKMPGAITGALRAFGSRNARRSAAPRVKFTLDTVNHATRPTRGTAGWSSLRQDSPEHTFTRQHGKPL